MNKNKAMAIIDMPLGCLECPFRGEIEYQPIGRGVYRKVAGCCFLEDSCEDVMWLINNKFDGCPLRPLPEELGVETLSGRDDWVSCKDCIYYADDCLECEGRDGCYFGDREE